MIPAKERIKNGKRLFDCYQKKKGGGEGGMRKEKRRNNNCDIHHIIKARRLISNSNRKKKVHTCMYRNTKGKETRTDWDWRKREIAD